MVPRILPPIPLIHHTFLDRVLIVDDDPMLRTYLQQLLRRRGYHVSTTTVTDKALVAVVDDEKPATPVLLWTGEFPIASVASHDDSPALDRIADDWESTFSTCSDLLVVLNGRGQILRVNTATAVRTGIESVALRGRTVAEVFPGELGTTIQSRVGTSCHTGPTSVFDSTLGGRFQVTVTPVRTARSVLWVVIAREAEGQTRDEISWRRTLGQLLSSVEEERRRVARELHDGIGQVLGSIAVRLSALAIDVDSSEVREQLRQLEQMVAGAIDDSRRMARGLRPSVLDDLGLIPALTRLADDYTRFHGIETTLIVPDRMGERLPPDIESAVYRIVQESLANVSKHARARTVDVVVEIAQEINVSVIDDGIGFTPSDRPTGLGLTGIRERATLLGGSARIDSGPGRGTVVTVRLPIAETPHDSDASGAGR